MDTLKQLQSDEVTGTTARDGLGRAQTPQLFRFDRINALHQAHDKMVEITDDILLFEAAGDRITAVPGDERLLKLTSPADFAILSALTSLRPARRPSHAACRASTRHPHRQRV